jgi:hypothetical protein
LSYFRKLQIKERFENDNHHKKKQKKKADLEKKNIHQVSHTHGRKKKISVGITCKRARISHLSNLHPLVPIFYTSVHLHRMMNEDDKYVDEDVFLVVVLESHKQESL